MSLEFFTVVELATRLMHPSPIDHSLYSGVFAQVETAHEGSLLLRDLASDTAKYHEHGSAMLRQAAYSPLSRLSSPPSTSVQKTFAPREPNGQNH